MTQSLYEYLSANEYPGRGICIGSSPSGRKTMIAYFIMGRSENSRNRIFEAIPGGIRTTAADPSKMEDPHLIIYNPVRTIGATTVVTNGDQTDTICDFIGHGLYPGYDFEAALATRCFEDDAPNFTPRISAAVGHEDGGFKLSILKSDNGHEDAVLRQYFDYPTPRKGEGRFISTYRGTGSPLPSFQGEPLYVAVDTEDPELWADRIWEALNDDNKVSLFIRAIDREKGSFTDIIRNKRSLVQKKEKKTPVRKPRKGRGKA